MSGSVTSVCDVCHEEWTYRRVSGMDVITPSPFSVLRGRSHLTMELCTKCADHAITLLLAEMVAADGTG